MTELDDAMQAAELMQGRRVLPAPAIAITLLHRLEGGLELASRRAIAGELEVAAELVAAIAETAGRVADELGWLAERVREDVERRGVPGEAG